MAFKLLQRVGSGVRENLRHHAVPSVFVPFRTHLGYIPRDGRLVLGNETTRLRTYAQLKKVNLKPVKKVHFTFDPFYPKVRSIRHAMYYLSADRIRHSGPKCFFKTEVVCDRREPTIRVELETGDSLLFKTANLTTEEIVTTLNGHILPLVKEETLAVLESKGAKKVKRK